jgi:hypothetical protein
MSLVAKLKGAREGSDALNGRHDEPRSIPERDYASVALGQRRWSLREVAAELKAQGFQKLGFTPFLDSQGLSDQVHTRGPGRTQGYIVTPKFTNQTKAVLLRPLATRAAVRRSSGAAPRAGRATTHGVEGVHLEKDTRQ